MDDSSDSLSTTSLASTTSVESSVVDAAAGSDDDEDGILSTSSLSFLHLRYGGLSFEFNISKILFTNNLCELPGRQSFTYLTIL